MSTKFTALELELFVEHTCSRCFQPGEAAERAGIGPGCPHKHRALDRDQLPGAWTRRRNGPLGETFKCEDFTAKPPVNRRGVTQDTTETMFDVETADKLLVPVDGWPDYRGRDRKGDRDHQ
jgi:hypothetical protein